jgi:hypothetical protein
MRRKSISRILVAAAPLAVVCGLLALIAAAKAQSNFSRSYAMVQFESGRCSDRTLSGNYAFTIEGSLLSIPGVTLPPGVTLRVRGLSLAHFDGKGV